MIFLVCTIFILAIIFYRMKKNITQSEIFFSWFFAISFHQTIDVYIDLKYDLYGYFKRGVDNQYILVLLVLFPLLFLVFINFYPFHKSLFKKIQYIIYWTIFSVLYEKVSLYTPMFYYNGWKLLWSLLIDPILFVINVLVFSFFRKLKEKEMKKDRENSLS